MKLLKKLTIWANVIMLFLVSQSFAGDTVIRNIYISNSLTHLLIRFQLANSFNKDLEEAIKTGIPITFKYYINLYKHLPLWNDKLLTSFTISKTLKYDPLKKEYIVTEKTSTGNGVRSSDIPTLPEAKKAMNNVEILSFYPMWKLYRNKSYYLKMKAESKGVEPPLFIHHLLFFLNWMNFETEWIVERFNY